MRKLLAALPFRKVGDVRSIVRLPTRPHRRGLGILEHCAACAALVISSTAAAVCDPQFGQVNVDGFGNEEIDYAWSMETFGEHLYVGTTGRTSSAEIWRYDGLS